MDPTFALAALTVLIGAFIFVVRSCFASKCNRFQIAYGCIDVERDVVEEMKDIRQQSSPSPAKPTHHPSAFQSRGSTPVQLQYLDIEKEDVI